MVSGDFTQRSDYAASADNDKAGRMEPDARVWKDASEWLSSSNEHLEKNWLGVPLDRIVYGLRGVVTCLTFWRMKKKKSEIGKEGEGAVRQ